MQVQIQIPEDLVDFLDTEAQKETIPTKFYIQRDFVDHYRQRKEYMEEIARNKSMLSTDGFKNEEEAREAEYQANKKRRKEQEEREMNMYIAGIEAVQAFTKAMVAQTDLAASTARAFDRIMAAQQE